MEEEFIQFTNLQGQEAENSSNVGINPSEQHRYNSGVGYIYIPSDIDKFTYIRDCYINNWVSIYIDGESIINRVHITPEVFNFIEFPLVQGQLGTCVVWVLDAIKKQIIIIGRLMKYDEVGNLEENAFSFQRKINESFVEIRGNCEKNYLNLLIAGEGDNTLINIIANNKKGTSQIHIESDGNINIKAANEVNINSSLIDFTSSNSDQISSIVQKPDSISFDADKVRVGSGDQSAMLGDIWHTFMEAFIDELGAITISTPQGQMPILNKDKVLKLKNRLQDILSEILFIE